MKIAIIYVDSKPLADSWTFARSEYPNMSDEEWEQMVKRAYMKAQRDYSDLVYFAITEVKLEVFTE